MLLHATTKDASCEGDQEIVLKPNSINRWVDLCENKGYLTEKHHLEIKDNSISERST